MSGDLDPRDVDWCEQGDGILDREDLRDPRDSSGDLRHLDDQGLIQRVPVNEQERAVTLTQDGRSLLERNRVGRSDHRQTFYAGADRARERSHDVQLSRALPPRGPGSRFTLGPAQAAAGHSIHAPPRSISDGLATAPKPLEHRAADRGPDCGGWRPERPLDSRALRPQDGDEEAMSDAYIEQREGMYLVSRTRVSLDSIVYAFLSGQSAEAIAQAFPVLNLEEVYGAITYYLGHRDEVDQYLESRRVESDTARQAARAGDPMFYQKLSDAKKHTPLTR
jgi:uncharacterized protein (DUF433 family)